MSRIFGEINQIAYVVHDARAAIDEWVALGVGPFFYFERFTLPYMKYRGVESSVDFRVAQANSGPLQIEIIEPLDDTPSPWREFLDAGYEGMQHVAYWTHDLPALVARARTLGYEVCMEGTVEANGGSRGGMAYLDNGPIPGTMIELSDISGRKGPVTDMIRQAALEWDGRDPIRGFDDIWALGAAQSS